MDSISRDSGGISEHETGIDPGTVPSHSENRCGPVERPVVPTRPRRSPFLTSCPACTLISDR